MRRDTTGTGAALAGLLALAVTVGVVGGGVALGANGERGDRPVEVATRSDATAAPASVDVSVPWDRWAPFEAPTTTTTTAAPTTTEAPPPPAPSTSAPRRTAAPATTAPPAPAPAPAPPPPPPPPPPAPPVGSATEQALLAAVNAQRAAGRSCGGTFYPATHALSLNSVLARAATAHAQDMRDHDFFSHTGSDGSDAGTRILRAGYAWRAWGENLAAGQTSAAAAVAGWFDSPGHCANFMSPAFTEVGFGSATGEGTTYGIYWAAALGAPR